MQFETFTLSLTSVCIATPLPNARIGFHHSPPDQQLSAPTSTPCDSPAPINSSGSCTARYHRARQTLARFVQFISTVQVSTIFKTDYQKSLTYFILVVEYRTICSPLSAFILHTTFTASAIRLPLVALKRTE
jgi:hypothetical protein